MYYEKIPFGEPKFFTGKYKKDNVYDLYIQMITCRFKLKEGKIPTIQIKNDRFHFVENEYLESSGDEDVVLCLTCIDLELFFEQYDVYSLEYISGWKFKSIKGLFTNYIDKWTKRKIEASKQGNRRSTNVKQIDVERSLWKIFHITRSPFKNSLSSK